MFFQSKDTSNANLMEDFKKVIANPSSHPQICNGAVLLAVFRGIYSEGVDFADNLCRSVICIGIPMTPVHDPLVKSKRDFNKKYEKELNILSGEEWYISNAFKALNQALGRYNKK